MSRRASTGSTILRRLGCIVAATALGAGVFTQLPAQALSAATAPPPLVVYSAEGYDAAVVHAFHVRTGITVRLDTNTIGTLVTQIEATKKHPAWGVFWADGPTVMARFDAQHLLVRGLGPTVHWNAVGKEVIPKDKSFLPTGVTLTAALLYTKTVVADPPTTWDDLFSSTWKGAVGMPTPTKAGSIYPFIAGTISDVGGRNGIAKGEQFFTRLKADGLVVRTTTSDTLQALTKGQIKLALLQSSAAVGAQRSNSNLAIAYLPPVTVLPSTIAVDSKVSKQEQAEAKEFVAFVLSPTGQQEMKASTPQNDSNFYPVVTGVQPLATLPQLSSIETDSITPYVWGPRQAAITTWFVKHVAK